MGAKAREGPGGATPQASPIGARFLPYVLSGTLTALSVGYISLRVSSTPIWVTSIMVFLGAAGFMRLAAVLETWRRRLPRNRQRIQGSLLATSVFLLIVTIWPGLSVTVRLLWPVVAGIAFALMVWRWGGHRSGKTYRRMSAFWPILALPLLVLIWAGAWYLVLLVWNVADPYGEGILYYFSSILQGYGAILGMTVMALLVSLQLGVSQYGLVGTPKRLLGNPWLWACLVFQGLVIVICAIALVLSPMPPLYCSILATGTLCAGVLGLCLTMFLIREVIRGLGPDAVMRSLARAIASSPNPEVREAADALERLSRDGWYPWTTGLGAYLQSLDQLVWRTRAGRREQVAERLVSPLGLVYRELPDKHRMEVARRMAVIVDSLSSRDSRAARALMAHLVEAYRQELIPAWAALFDQDFKAWAGSAGPALEAGVSLVQRSLFATIAAGKDFLTAVLAQCASEHAYALGSNLERTRGPASPVVNEMLVSDSDIFEVMLDWFGAREAAKESAA